MHLQAFTENAYKDLEFGKDHLIIGFIGLVDTFDGIVGKWRTAFEDPVKTIMRMEFMDAKRSLVDNSKLSISSELLLSITVLYG